MANEPTTLEDAPIDPFEAELVAYLDGELDPAAARKVEARLERDPVARARAEELKRTFDLLDYLPKPDPSPTFTTRTIDKLPAVKSDSVPQPPATAPTAAARPSGSNPVVPASTSMPLALDDAEPARASPRWLLWGAAACAVAVACAVAGYFVAGAARPRGAAQKESEEQRVEVPSRVAEYLSLYVVADDIAFVTELAKPELFGDDPSVAYDPTLRVPPGEAHDRPAGKDLEALARAFRSLPAARQAEIVKLDHDLAAKEPRERDRLFRALEAYAAWLDRLPEAERRGVLAAPTPGLRRDLVRRIRDQQWTESLPPSVRARPDLVQLWREDEAHRRDRIAFIRQHAEAFAANKSPWPFETEQHRKDVIDFARTVFRIDDPKRNRLTPEQHAVYTRVLTGAERDGTWAWYGLVVYELSKAHPYLPEPVDPKMMYTDRSDVPQDILARLRKGAAGQLNAVAGKWPEFPLELHREILRGKSPGVPQLGPARPSEFREPVATFTNKQLLPKLTAEEKRGLQKLEGKWPEYPRELLRLAHEYDLPVPGVTLPFSPKKWDATYGTRP
jgi:hypothetical protein